MVHYIGLPILYTNIHTNSSCNYMRGSFCTVHIFYIVVLQTFFNGFLKQILKTPNEVIFISEAVLWFLHVYWVSIIVIHPIISTIVLNKTFFCPQIWNKNLEQFQFFKVHFKSFFIQTFFSNSNNLSINEKFSQDNISEFRFEY